MTDCPWVLWNQPLNAWQCVQSNTRHVNDLVWLVLAIVFGVAVLWLGIQIRDAITKSGEGIMSQEAALTAVLSKVGAAVTNAISQSQNVTPDAVVTAAVGTLSAAADSLNTAFPPPTPPTPPTP